MSPREVELVRRLAAPYQREHREAMRQLRRLLGLNRRSRRSTLRRRLRKVRVRAMEER